MEINTQGSVEALVLNTQAIKSHSDSKFAKTIFWAFPLCWKSTEDCGLCLFILWSSQLHYWNWKHGWMKEHTNEWMNNWRNGQIKSIWCSLGNPGTELLKDKFLLWSFEEKGQMFSKEWTWKLKCLETALEASYHCLLLSLSYLILRKWTPYFADV